MMCGPWYGMSKVLVERRSGIAIALEFNGICTGRAEKKRCAAPTAKITIQSFPAE